MKKDSVFQTSKMWTIQPDSSPTTCFVNNNYRVPTGPGKPGKMRVHLENLEISWNFEKFNKYHGKMT